MRPRARSDLVPLQRTGLDLRAAPGGLESEKIFVGDDEYLVLSFPALPVPTDGLTSAEAAVLRHVLGGLSNRDIAKRRNTSVRTVANQVAAILRKLGFRSRYELVATLS